MTDSFTLIDSADGGIVMRRADEGTLDIERDYMPLDLPQSIKQDGKEYATQDALSRVFAAALQGGGMAMAAGHGLYTANVPMPLLTKLANGSYLGMVKGADGKIVQNARFMPVGGDVFAPLVIFQALAMATGQYYMHGIATQLNGINAKLDELIRLAIEDKLGTIESAKALMRELSSTKCANMNDLTKLALAENEVRGVFAKCVEHLRNINIDKIVDVGPMGFTRQRLKDMAHSTSKCNASGENLVWRSPT